MRSESVIKSRLETINKLIEKKLTGVIPEGGTPLQILEIRKEVLEWVLDS